MNKQLFRKLYSWPKGYITDVELGILINKSNAARYGLVNRALKDGDLVHIRRGLFMISRDCRTHVDSFELAQIIYGPSFY